jgi:hypothetical protein
VVLQCMYHRGSHITSFYARYRSCARGPLLVRILLLRDSVGSGVPGDAAAAATRRRGAAEGRLETRLEGGRAILRRQTVSIPMVILHINEDGAKCNDSTALV